MKKYSDKQRLNGGSFTGRESGATLVIALIILLVMSVVGVANMQNSTMQERMAANARQKTVARYAAESALGAAESVLRGIKSPEAIDTRFNGSGYYSLVARPSNVAVPLSASLSGGAQFIPDKDSTWSNITSVEVDYDTSIVAKKPRYIVEYIGRDMTQGANKVVTVMDVDNDGGDTKPYLYRITAIGWGKDPNIYSVLESTFQTGYGDDVFVY
jgi:Tfp pilus assembly protein PilX